MSKQMPSVLVLDVAKWRCGHDGPHKLGRGLTCLLNQEGFMCCLGQIAEQAGVFPGALLNIGEPCDLAATVDGLNSYDEDEACNWNSELSNDCMTINDEPKIPNHIRVGRLARRLARDGFRLRVKNFQLLADDHETTAST